MRAELGSRSPAPEVNKSFSGFEPFTRLLVFYKEQKIN